MEADAIKRSLEGSGLRCTTQRFAVMSFLMEFWDFLRQRKKFWLLPILIVLVVFGGLIVLTQGSAIAPFIYTLF